MLFFCILLSQYNQYEPGSDREQAGYSASAHEYLI